MTEKKIYLYEQVKIMFTDGYNGSHAPEIMFTDGYNGQRK